MTGISGVVVRFPTRTLRLKFGKAFLLSVVEVRGHDVPMTPGADVHARMIDGQPAAPSANFAFDWIEPLLFRFIPGFAERLDLHFPILPFVFPLISSPGASPSGQGLPIFAPSLPQHFTEGRLILDHRPPEESLSGSFRTGCRPGPLLPE